MRELMYVEVGVVGDVRGVGAIGVGAVRIVGVVSDRVGTGVGTDCGVATPIAPTNGITEGNPDCAPTSKGVNVKRQSMRDAREVPIRYVKEGREFFMGI